MTMVDVDGFFPIDQASDDSEAKQIMKHFIESQGIKEGLDGGPLKSLIINIFPLKYYTIRFRSFLA